MKSTHSRLLPIRSGWRLCLRRAASGRIVVAKSAASETGTVPSGVLPTPTEGGKAPTGADAGVPAKPSMTAEPGESPGRSAAGFDLAVEFEGTFLRKKPSEIEKPHLTCLTRPPRPPKSPPGGLCNVGSPAWKRIFFGWCPGQDQSGPDTLPVHRRRSTPDPAPRPLNGRSEPKSPTPESCQLWSGHPNGQGTWGLWYLSKAHKALSSNGIRGLGSRSHNVRSIHLHNGHKRRRCWVRATTYAAFSFSLLDTATCGGKFRGLCAVDLATVAGGRRDPGRGLPRKMRIRLESVSQLLSNCGSARAASRESFSPRESAEPVATAAS